MKIFQVHFVRAKKKYVSAHSCEKYGRTGRIKRICKISALFNASHHNFWRKKSRKKRNFENLKMCAWNEVLEPLCFGAKFFLPKKWPVSHRIWGNSMALPLKILLEYLLHPHSTDVSRFYDSDKQVTSVCASFVGTIYLIFDEFYAIFSRNGLNTNVLNLISTFFVETSTIQMCLRVW